jgi:hypothetical protein
MTISIIAGPWWFSPFDTVERYHAIPANSAFIVEHCHIIRWYPTVFRLQSARAEEFARHCFHHRIWSHGITLCRKIWRSWSDTII